VKNTDQEAHVMEISPASSYCLPLRKLIIFNAKTPSILLQFVLTEF